MNMRTRLTAAALLAATAFGLSAAPGAPAGADVTPVPDAKAASKVFSFAGFAGDSDNPANTESFTAPGTTPIVGNFKGNAIDDIFWYTPGAGGDELWTGTGGYEFTETAISVSGSYTPYVGTFSAIDYHQDILWYSATAASQVWDFNPDGSITKSSMPAVTGPGQILIGDFAGDGIADVIRYRPGVASDSWWDFQTMSVAGRAFNVNGTYTPIVGAFAGDVITDILFYAPGQSSDFLWDFNGGGAKEEWKLGINGTYTPVVGGFSLDGAQDILWYAPGAAGDSYWDFETGTYETKAMSINGTYKPVACTCLQSGSPWADVVFYGAGNAADAAWKTTSAQQLIHANVGTSIGGSSVAAVGSFHEGSTLETLLIRH